MKKGGIQWELVIVIVSLFLLFIAGLAFKDDIEDVLEVIKKGIGIETAEQAIAEMQEINEERFDKDTEIVLDMFVESGYTQAKIIKQEVGQGWTLTFSNLEDVAVGGPAGGSGQVGPIKTIIENDKLENILDNQQLWATIETTKGVFMHIPDPNDTSAKRDDLRWFFDKNNNNSFDEGEDKLDENTEVTTTIVARYIKEDLVRKELS